MRSASMKLASSISAVAAVLLLLTAAPQVQGQCTANTTADLTSDSVSVPSLKDPFGVGDVIGNVAYVGAQTTSYKSLYRFSLTASGAQSAIHIAGSGAAGRCTANAVGTSAVIGAMKTIADSRNANTLIIMSRSDACIQQVSTIAPYAVSILVKPDLPNYDIDGNGNNAGWGTIGGMVQDVDNPNDFYFTDFSFRKLKKITMVAPYTVTTVAGDGTAANTPGVGTAAQLGIPAGIAGPINGKLYMVTLISRTICTYTIATSVVAVDVIGGGATDSSAAVLGSSYAPTAINFAAFNEIADVSNNNGHGNLVFVDTSDKSLWMYNSVDNLIYFLGRSPTATPNGIVVEENGDIWWEATNNNLALTRTVRTGCATPMPTPIPVCACAASVDVDYNIDLVPDATADAYASISLDESNFNVVFEVFNVKHLTRGHVIAGKLNTRTNATSAFEPMVASYDPTELWVPKTCVLGGLDVPNPSLDIVATRYANCSRSYRTTFSLVNPAARNSYCQLITQQDDIIVSCHLTITSTRAYDSTEPSAFLAAESGFTGNITLPRNLHTNVTDLLSATLAKCDVLEAPQFSVDCRIPGHWNFDGAFTVAQNIPNWINASSCGFTHAASATFIHCSLSGVPVSAYTTAEANISATVAGTSEQITFSLQYTLPRLFTAAVSGSLSNFIVTAGLLNEKYYYAGSDRATLFVEVFDTSRLSISQLDLFNDNGQIYALRENPEFALVETTNATHFFVEFRPSAIRRDSAFYRFGPHGVNLSFVFTAATNRRQMQLTQRQGSDGYVRFDDLNIADPGAAPEDGNDVPAGNAPAAGPTGGSVPVITIAIIGGSLVLAMLLLSVTIVIKHRRKMNAESYPSDIEGGDFDPETVEAPGLHEGEEPPMDSEEEMEESRPESTLLTMTRSNSIVDDNDERFAELQSKVKLLDEWKSQAADEIFTLKQNQKLRAKIDDLEEEITLLRSEKVKAMTQCRCPVHEPQPSGNPKVDQEKKAELIRKTSTMALRIQEMKEKLALREGQTSAEELTKLTV